MVRKYLTIISGLVFTATTGIVCPMNTKAIEDIEPVEVLSMRSEYEKHYDNGDGTYTAYIDTVPLHYYENGEWLDIDNTLIQDENGNYVNKSNSMKVTLSPETSLSSVATLSEEPDDNNQMVSVDYNGYSLSWSLFGYDSVVGYSSTENNEFLDSDIFINALEEIDSDNNESQPFISSLNKLESSASYNSVCNNVDIDINVCPYSVIETINLNCYDDIPDSFTYYLKSDGLSPIINDSNEIEFVDSDNNIVFTVPSLYMKDSNANISKNVVTNIMDYEEGYLLTFSPDFDWLSSEEIVYPVTLSSEVITNNNAYTYYISESNPQTSYTNQNLLYMGGSSATNSRYETIINNPGLASNLNDMTLIKKATFNIYFNPNNQSGTNQSIEIHSIDQNFSYPYWNSCGGSNVKTTKLDSINLSQYDGGMKAFDITKSSQNFLNYIRTGSYIGSYCYGYKLKTSSDSRRFIAYSERSTKTAPYFEIIYSTNSKYNMCYSPYKYNDSGNLKNFQKRMNCYAYALQVYYRDYSENPGYYLRPGEFGISNIPSNDKYNIKKYSDLMNNYDYFNDRIVNVVYNVSLKTSGDHNIFSNQSTVMADKDFLNVMRSYSDFVEEQMKRDAGKLNFSISKINGSSKFTLPIDFDENSERIIAMITYHKADTYYSGISDYHFYLRNGNGTCPNHEGNCSTWSNKMGLNEVKNSCCNQIICDENINEHAYHTGTVVGGANIANRNDIRYYRITKDTNIYDSWHSNGHFDDNKGTAYRP